MNDYTKINHKRYSDRQNNYDNKKIKYLKNLVTRILISIILIIGIAIFIKVDSNNVFLVDEYVFQDSLKFTTINKWYQKTFGKIIPEAKSDAAMVFENDDLKKNSYEKYLDGVKIKMPKNSPVTILNGGIVVFIGEKDGYGNTVIIQGNDGIDYWYGNVTNTAINLYDYLEKDTLIGNSKDDYLYLVLEKDNQYLDYEKYLQ